MDVSSNRPRVFSPVGRCIYCSGDGGGTLTREHIIPAGIGGGLILPDASCTSCQKIIQVFETTCMRKTLLPFRKATGLVRHGKDLPTSLPLAFDLDLKGPTKIRLSEHPNVVIFPGLRDPPGIFVGRPPENTINFEYAIFAGVEILDETQRRLIDQQRVGIGVDGVAWVRLLAKIAHGIAVAELGLGGFTPSLPDLILGKNPDLASYLVGRGMKPMPVLNPAPLHDIQLHRATFSGGEVSVVNLRLFAELGLKIPTYSVVVGSSNTATG